jgi:hypothetical protein
MVEINLYAQLAIAKRSHHGKDEAGAANPKVAPVIAWR